MSDDGIPSEFIQLPPEVVLELLKGHESILMPRAEEDARKKESISQRCCPKCGQALIPVPPTDVTKIFMGGRMQYVGACSACRYREDFTAP